MIFEVIIVKRDMVMKVTNDHSLVNVRIKARNEDPHMKGPNGQGPKIEPRRSRKRKITILKNVAITERNLTTKNQEMLQRSVANTSVRSTDGHVPDQQKNASGLRVDVPVRTIHQRKRKESILYQGVLIENATIGIKKKLSGAKTRMKTTRANIEVNMTNVNTDNLH